MILIQNIFIDANVLSSEFQCNISACKGACCVEGDIGAPVLPSESKEMEGIVSEIEPFISRKGVQKIQSSGTSVYYEKEKTEGTPLLEDGACAYAVRDSNGIIQCGIEQAYGAGATQFKKPVSCELYPIRVERHPENGCYILKYDRWDICNPACSFGQLNSMPLYRFVKHGLVRRFGAEFYEILDQYAVSAGYVSV
jgi:hypothetical protein